jgi:phosphoribosyl 1,2-cyclic phosphate phosphodiesterase
MIGCRCDTCRSDDPRDRRWRPSIAIALDGGSSILVDASPDLRSQALRYGLTRVDALLFTHSHADHIMGLDDLRAFNYLQRAVIPCFGDPATIADVRRAFAYVFDPSPTPGGGVPQLVTFHLGGPFCLGGATIVPVPVMHGPRPILGYRVGRFAYLTDCNAIPGASWPLIEGIEVLVLDALRDRPHPTHFTVAEAVDTARRIGAARTYLTHMTHDLRHEPTSARLPDGIELAYDGLTLDGL